MRKKIKIGSKEFEIKSSAYTMFAYKNETGRDFLKDLNKVNSLNKKTSKLSKEEKQKFWVDNFNTLIDLVLELTYVMAKEADESICDYKSWLSSFDTLMEDPRWMKDVLEVGMSPFRGKLQNNKHNQQ